MNNSNQKSASSYRLEYIKRMCVLNDAGQMLVPLLFKELHALVPSYSGTFYWINQEGKVRNIFDPSPDADKCAKLYIENFLDRRDIEAQPSITKWALSNEIVTTSERFIYKNFYRSAFYNEILRPLKYHHKLLTAVKYHGLPIGLLLLHRTNSEKLFLVREEKIMRNLAPFIAYGLTKTTNIESMISGTSELGLLIFSDDCKLQFLSPQGRRHLFFATHPAISEETLKREHLPVQIPPEVICLCKQIILMNSDAGMQGPPVWQHRNSWGGFVFRAQLLESGNNSNSYYVAITIEHQEPAKYKIIRRCKELGLSPRQIDICTYLVEGKTYEDIGSVLHISANTVIDHTRRLFDKLHVKSRGELASKLMTN